MYKVAYILCVCSILLGSATMTGAQNGGEALSNLSNQEKRSKVDGDLKKIKDTLKFAQAKLDKARENKDVIQLNCVNDKLSGIKGFLKIAEQAKKGLDEAINRSDQDLIDHEFTKVTIATMRVENWRLEVEGCVGELSQYTGKSEISVQTDSNIREDDPSAAEFKPTFEALNATRPPAVTGSE